MADSRLKLYWQAKLRSIDSGQNGTYVDHYQKTNNRILFMKTFYNSML